jgi:hypothetical protein
MREELTKDGTLTQFTLQLREQKCIEKMLETAKIEEVEPSKVRKVRRKPAAKATKPAKAKEAKAEKEDEADDKSDKKGSREETATKRSRKGDDKKADKKEK